MRTRDKILLYLSNKLGCCFPGACWPDRKKFTKVFEKGAERIDQELNIIYFMNNLRNLKILLKNSLMKDPEIRMKIKHDEKNLIDLDQSSEGPPSDANFGDVGEYRDLDEDKHAIRYEQRHKKRLPDDPSTLFATPRAATEDKRANTFFSNTVGLVGPPPLTNRTPMATQNIGEAPEDQEDELAGGSEGRRRVFELSKKQRMSFEPLETKKKERGASSGRKRARQRHEVYREVYRERSRVSKVSK